MDPDGARLVVLHTARRPLPESPRQAGRTGAVFRPPLAVAAGNPSASDAARFESAPAARPNGSQSWPVDRCHSLSN